MKRLDLSWREELLPKINSLSLLTASGDDVACVKPGERVKLSGAPYVHFKAKRLVLGRDKDAFRVICLTCGAVALYSSGDPFDGGLFGVDFAGDQFEMHVSPSMLVEVTLEARKSNDGPRLISALLAGEEMRDEK